MTRERVYLKPNVLFEPLFNQWYAWTYLIAPQTAAMIVANQHLKIMQSFVAAPQVHVAALKNPSMLGGPFLSYGAERAAEVRELHDRTAAEHAPQLRFADAVRRLDDLLAREATGYSLEPLYRQVPEELRGYVELVYDANNHPSIRFIEGLLYRSPYYNPAAQSVALSLVESDARPFILSTPALAGDGRLHLRIPFASDALDELFRMQAAPGSYARIREMLGVPDEEDALFSTFFTEAPPAPPVGYDGPGVRVRYFGHACVLVETAEVSILCDPVASYQYEAEGERFTYADLPSRIDYVLLTHNHQDHCIFEAMLQLRHRIGQVIVPRSSGGELVDPSLKLILRQVGFRDVVEIGEMESIPVPGGHITGVPFLGEHGDLNIKTKMAYYLSLLGRGVMCAADSNNIEPRLYERVRPHLGPVDVLFLGMECDGAPLSWLYGPLLTRPLARRMDQSRRFDGSDFAKASAMIETLDPGQVYVYAMGQEPWLTFLTSLVYTDESRPIVESNKLVEYCRRRQVAAKRLYGCEEIMLAPG